MPGCHPGAVDFKTFRPLRLANPNDFQVRSAHTSWAAGALTLRAGTPALPSGSPGPAPSRVCSPQARGLAANPEGAEAERPRHLLSTAAELLAAACKVAGGDPFAGRGD